MYLIFCCTGTVAYRNISEGSLYIQETVKVIIQNAAKMHLIDMLTQVDKHMHQSFILHLKEFLKNYLENINLNKEENHFYFFILICMCKYLTTITEMKRCRFCLKVQIHLETKPKFVFQAFMLNAILIPDKINNCACFAKLHGT